jgi:glutamine cyclotransferase
MDYIKAINQNKEKIMSEPDYQTAYGEGIEIAKNIYLQEYKDKHGYFPEKVDEEAIEEIYYELCAKYR